MESVTTLGKARASFFAFFATSINAICAYNSLTDACIFLYDDNFYPIDTMTVSIASYYLVDREKRNGYITRDLKYMVKGTELHSMAIDTEKLEITTKKIRDVNSQALTHNGNYSGYCDDPVVQYITDVSNKILVVYSIDGEYGDLSISIYSVDFEAKDSEVFKLKSYYQYSSVSKSYDYDSGNPPYYLRTLKSTTDGKEIFSSVFARDTSSIEMFNTMPDYSEVISLKYKGEYYYRLRGGGLTAKQEDVKKDKTFIGWNGYTETGTMEV